MITVQNLTRRFGPITAVDGISFRVEKGDVLGFLGPNGAGKSTAMKMLACFLTPDGGTTEHGGGPVFLTQPARVTLNTIRPCNPRVIRPCPSLVPARPPLHPSRRRRRREGVGFLRDSRPPLPGAPAPDLRDAILFLPRSPVKAWLVPPRLVRAPQRLSESP